MKRAAWLVSVVAVAALASAGCALQVAGQGQDQQQVGSTNQGLGQDQNSAGPASTASRTSVDEGTGGGQLAAEGDPTKPTPDPWRASLATPVKPTPDPWRPDNTASTSDSSQSGGNPGGTSTTQSGTMRASAH